MISTELYNSWDWEKKQTQLIWYSREPRTAKGTFASQDFRRYKLCCTSDPPLTLQFKSDRFLNCIATIWADIVIFLEKPEDSVMTCVQCKLDKGTHFACFLRSSRNSIQIYRCYEFSTYLLIEFGCRLSSNSHRKYLLSKFGLQKKSLR